VEVKLLEQSNVLYILAKSTGRMHKGQTMRQRKLNRVDLHSILTHFCTET
jgi:hypothetical protein